MDNDMMNMMVQINVLKMSLQTSDIKLQEMGKDIEALKNKIELLNRLMGEPALAEKSGDELRSE